MLGKIGKHDALLSFPVFLSLVEQVATCAGGAITGGVSSAMVACKAASQPKVK
jgi:hypothetical protein